MKLEGRRLFLLCAAKEAEVNNAGLIRFSAITEIFGCFFFLADKLHGDTLISGSQGRRVTLKNNNVPFTSFLSSVLHRISLFRLSSLYIPFALRHLAATSCQI